VIVRNEGVIIGANKRDAASSRSTLTITPGPWNSIRTTDSTSLRAKMRRKRTGWCTSTSSCIQITSTGI